MSTFRRPLLNDKPMKNEETYREVAASVRVTSWLLDAFVVIAALDAALSAATAEAAMNAELPLSVSVRWR